mgnify:CR=1 FL=1
MEYKEELLPAAFKSARSKRERAVELGITPSSTKEELEAIAIARAQAKVISDGGKLSEYIKGQEFYVNSLQSAISADKSELLKSEYKELSIMNSSFDELVDML